VAVISILQLLVVSASSSSGLAALLAETRRGVAGGHLRDGAFLLSTIYDVYMLNLVRGAVLPNVMRHIIGVSGLWSIMPLIMIEALLAFMVLQSGKASQSRESDLVAGNLDHERVAQAPPTRARS